MRSCVGLLKCIPEFCSGTAKHCMRKKKTINIGEKYHSTLSVKKYYIMSIALKLKRT